MTCPPDLMRLRTVRKKKNDCGSSSDCYFSKEKTQKVKIKPKKWTKNQRKSPEKKEAQTLLHELALFLCTACTLLKIKILQRVHCSIPQKNHFWKIQVQIRKIWPKILLQVSGLNFYFTLLSGFLPTLQQLEQDPGLNFSFLHPNLKKKCL